MLSPVCAKLLPTVWKHFPAAFESSTIPSSTDAIVLGQRESKLRVLEPCARTASPTAAKISGRAFKLVPNDQGALTVRFDFFWGAVRYSLSDDRGAHFITSGMGRWNEQNTTMTGARLHHEYQPDTMRVVADAAWRSPDQLEMTWQYVAASRVIESR